MCGICGFISNNPVTMDNLINMNNTLSHRGPDDHGEEIYQISSNRYVGLAQRRLSILDLSSKGHQPMYSSNKRVSVVYNGEIYNFLELKQELKEYPFVSDCDTEVIIAAYLKWGINFVDRINGMFAIALLDRNDNSLYLIRDRIGKKPLYYYCGENNSIVFASELKAIMQSSFFKKEIDKDVIGGYLYRGYINAPKTIFKNTYKLEPGAVLHITETEKNKYKYWDVAEKNKELRKQKVLDYELAKQELKELLKASVKSRMISDVPLGAFLSGGYDSSLVCAIAQQFTSSPLKTFSIGFYDEKYNEAKESANIAKHLGTDHTELYITENDMLGIIDSIPQYYDEPFADSSQIPTMLVSKLAKEQVSVALSGDGGDELFGGYNIYTIMQEAQKIRYKGFLLHVLSRFQQFRQSNVWKNRTLIEKIVSDDLNPEVRTQAGVNGYFESINSILVNKTNNFYFEYELKYDEKRFDTTRMLLDLDTYLPGDILTKVDRASMRYALECRCPILDKNIIEYSFRFPSDFKDDHGKQKRILKDIAYEYIPKELLDRPKKGFAIPLDSWLRNELKEQVYAAIDKGLLLRQGIFDIEATRSLVETYMKSGNQGKNTGNNYAGIVWSFLMFQKWYMKYGSNVI